MMKKQVIFGVILLAIFVIFLDSTQVGATRLLRTTFNSEFVFESLQKGTVPGSGPNGCSNIPNGSGSCHG
ncbi:hypothetical protein ISN45_Aa04g015630 [Arabidopsis thaliana x Arabidopsis arenosa]|uniref:Transmembrane protein n=1 Tax=Arabidopsis thaliana x Arabidopsis arenosa TaxID=1240361 RepID=A0A8T2A5B4_9BRAS|nr:hypothetical protein ISN45_Aa04g015630 [Arabidopsis thaliana x Arabidopsis arenosa]